MGFVLWGTLTACQESLPCNGGNHLCDRRIDQICVAGAHNAMSSTEDGFIPPNHNLGIEKQLEGGIRGLNIDLFWFEDQIYMCHYDCRLGKRTLFEGLEIISNFLDNNPQEIIFITFQSALNANDVLLVFEEAGLKKRLYHHTVGSNWPTLGRLIEQRKNIIAFSDRGGGVVDGYHEQWVHWIDNPYQASTISDFACAPDRGDTETATLYNVNHFISAPIALEGNTAMANEKEIVEEHVYRCYRETGLFPNQILVDFWSIGEILSLVNDINAGSLDDM